MPSTIGVRAALTISLAWCSWGCGDEGGAGGPPGDGGATGCGLEPTIALGAWTPQSVAVPGGGSPAYFVRLPAGYDPDTEYPVVYQLHGCYDGENRQDNNVPVENESGDAAIHVRGRAAASCWDTSQAGADVPYFDALVDAVEARHCTDPDRRFLAGYSSGAFMAHRLGCIRGDGIRALATIAGGSPPGSDCAGDVAVLQIHDVDDETVVIEDSGYPTRDGWLEANGCESGTSATDHPPCEAYAGCGADTPVVFCETAGHFHDRQDSFAAEVFWDFFSAFP